MLIALAVAGIFGEWNAPVAPITLRAERAPADVSIRKRLPRVAAASPVAAGATRVTATPVRTGAPMTSA